MLSSETVKLYDSQILHIYVPCTKPDVVIYPLQGSTEDFALTGLKKKGALKLLVLGRVWVLNESGYSAGLHPMKHGNSVRSQLQSQRAASLTHFKKQVQQASKSAFKMIQRF